ncbi:PTS sugar transporter subunit IIA [Anaerosacchariphilus polymeriproducens]|uniref:PTS glucose transporter subunit IIA n=1 Tax=Anaerosacchariphilus polymeriproducens TaxID=1812858 RepID=A0A371AS49_9FIRM|nr:PTS glucose transporter subunit IIA [Anaerosacchariphilus polymeriproducens]RDU22396.1 PTS glucose transporter subunit IIA [Anaerosacchariphilus polymeriproducens]
MFSLFKKEKGNKNSNSELKAFLSGKVVEIESVPDEAFSNKVLGDGLAIIPADNEVNEVLAPADGEVTLLMPDSNHACGLKLINGLEILIHIGIDTVDMRGDGFEVLVSQGQKVKAGEKLIRFNTEKIKEAGHPTVTVLVVTDDTGKSYKLQTNVDSVAGETTILTLEA